MPIDPASLEVDETENYFAFRTKFEVPFPVMSSLKAGKTKTKKGGGGGDSSSGGEEEEGGGDEEENDDGEGEDEDPSNLEQHSVLEELLNPLLLISKDPFVGVKGDQHDVRTKDMMLVSVLFYPCIFGVWLHVCVSV